VIDFLLVHVENKFNRYPEPAVCLATVV